MKVKCLNCGRGYPQEGLPHRCPVCGGLYDLAASLTFDPQSLEPALPGIWRYRHSFVLPDGARPLSLGEGRRPLVWASVGKRRVGFLCEFLNPTGSFKDRGTALLVSALQARSVSEAVEDSSGNAGASFAAYAARAGLKARVFVPASASGPKRAQIEIYGAEVVPVPGPRSAATEAALAAVEAGATYASHAWLPFNLAGYATAAYDLFEALEGAPAAVIVPAGQGGLLLGMARGFAALRAAGRIASLPKMIGVQAAAVAPLWTIARLGLAFLSGVVENPSAAEGVRVRDPLRASAVLSAVRESGGEWVAVAEERILPARDALARLGLYVEPTSALAWSALEDLLPALADPVVVVLTGSGYKAPSI